MRVNEKIQSSIKRTGLDLPQVIIIGLILFILIWFIGNGVYNLVNTTLVRTYEIESEFERRSIQGMGFLRTENNMIQSDILGEIKPIKREGTRVAKNHVVFSVAGNTAENTSKKEFYAPISGLVSYHIDGYELLKTADDIRGLDFNRMYEVEKSSTKKTVVSEKGERVAKVIDNLKPVLLYMNVPKLQKPVFAKVGDIVRVDFKDLGETTKATVVSMKDNPDGKTIFCEFELVSASDKLLTNRVLNPEIYILKEAVLEISAGTIVPADDKKTLGVFVLNDGIVAWRPLEVIDQQGELYYCKSLPEKTVIILNPDRVKVGDIM